jgi:hypothetical protein
MEDGLEDVDNDASRQGSCAHAHGEHRLQKWLGLPLDYAREADIPDHDEFYDEAFSDFVDEYVEYVKERVQALRAEHGAENVIVLLEQRLDFSRWVPDGFGTGDVVIIVPGCIYVIDLKFGQGIWVDGEDNDQMKLYGLGAFDRYDVLYDFDAVDVTIHQPRKDNISGERIPVADLLRWADEYVRPRALIAHTGVGATFAPGAHCRDAFCKARFNCRARTDHNMAMANEDFAMKPADTLTLAEVEQVAERAAELAAWAKDVEKYLLARALAGDVLTLHKLVEGRSNRRIKDVSAAVALLIEEGYDRSSLFQEPKIVPLGQLESLVGKKKLPEILGELLIKPEGRATLASINSKKPAKEMKTLADDFS